MNLIGAKIVPNDEEILEFLVQPKVGEPYKLRANDQKEKQELVNKLWKAANKDSLQKDFQQKDSQQKNSEQKDPSQKDSNQKDSSQKDSQQKNFQQKNSNQQVNKNFL